MKRAFIGSGDVDIELNGETVTLRPTLKLALAIGRQFDGPGRAVQALGNGNLDVMANVIALATGRTPDAVGEAIWLTPGRMKHLVKPVSEFLVTLMTDDEDAGGEGVKNPPTAE